MIDEHKDSKCRVFFCYRQSGAETAKFMKSYLKSVPDKSYGRVWYSDDENVGNYDLDIPVLIKCADIFVLFLAEGFTEYFLTPSGEANLFGYEGALPCITLKEMVEIEKQRQLRDITVLTVNIDGYTFSKTDINRLVSAFEGAGILREDTKAFYENLNINNYYRRQTDIASYTQRIMKDLEEKRIIEKKVDFDSGALSDGLSLIDENEYRNCFQALIKSAAYPVVKFFGYTGEVLSADLLTYLSRYSLNIEMRILQRNYVIEELDEQEHNARIPANIRPWNKSKAIKQMCYEVWNYSLKRTIRYYSHHPILKGCLFCNSEGRAIIGFVNFQRWDKMPSSGGSVFKSVPSDMIMLNPENNVNLEILLARLNSQFEYEWEHSLSQDEMKNYVHKNEDIDTFAKTLIIDFDRTLFYLYVDTTLLTDLAKIICDYYSAYIDVPIEYYSIDGYHAWHKLHRMVCEKLDYEDAFDINNVAEKKVTDFEFEVMGKTKFLDGAVAAIRELYNRGIELMIVSSNSTRMIKAALKREGIEDCFSNIMGRPIPFDPDKIKPNPYPIKVALQKTKTDKSRCWYVGDDLVDIDSAKACGITSIGVASGKYSADELEKRGADRVYNSFKDILS